MKKAGAGPAFGEGTRRLWGGKGKALQLRWLLISLVISNIET